MKSRDQALSLLSLSGPPKPKTKLRYQEKLEFHPQLFLTLTADGTNCLLENHHAGYNITIGGVTALDFAHLGIGEIFSVDGKKYVVLRDGEMIFNPKTREEKERDLAQLRIFCNEGTGLRSFSNSAPLQEKIASGVLERFSSGSAVTEFIIAFPIFLVLCLGVMELATMWFAKHYVSLAAFSAARSLILEESDDPCNEADPEHDAILGRAKKAAVLRTTAIAPSYEFFLSQFGSIGTARESQSQVESGIVNTLSKAIVYMVKRIIPAYFMTSVDCKKNSDKSVSAEVTFFYQPIIPVIKDIVWGVYVLQQFPQIEQYTNMLRGFFQKNKFDILRDTVESYVPGLLNSSQDLIWGVMSPADHLALKVPEVLRFIPVSVEARAVKPRSVDHDKNWDEGQSKMIAPFGKTESHAEKTWSEWAKNMVTKFSK